MKKEKIVMITGSAGFIGMHTSEMFLKKGFTVVGIDNMNDYYNPLLKRKRNAILKKYPKYIFHKADLVDYKTVKRLVKKHQPQTIINLAAQAGVRYSIINPWSYINSNIMALVNVFEAARECGVKNVIYASSSSVYGKSNKSKFKESDRTDEPVSVYAATKKATEALGHAYHDLHGLNTIGLRFFTVYGPYDRPDMALWMFSNKMLQNQAIDIFAKGVLKRDFTYIDDIVGGIWGAYKLKNAGYRIYNLGGNKTHSVNQFVSYIEDSLGVKAIRHEMPFQKGDVPKTSADISLSKKELSYNPKTSLKDGIKKRSQWLLDNQDWVLKI